MATPRPELRALARWHASRRAVEQVVEPLLAYGPMATERVSERLGELRAMLAEEQAAFDTFVALVEQRSTDAVVVDLFATPLAPTEP